MDYYLTPKHIAEALGITKLRKSTATGLYLLSENDIVAYGKQRAIDEGAIPLSNSRSVSAESTEEKVVDAEPTGENKTEEPTETETSTEAAEPTENEENTEVEEPTEAAEGAETTEAPEENEPVTTDEVEAAAEETADDTKENEETKEEEKKK